MERQRRIQIGVIAVLSIAILAMSVGFAASAYLQTLDVNGSASVTASKWAIAFDTASYAESSGSVAATTHTLTGTTMAYTITLAEPGDYYEFTVNVKNTGTFDASLTALTMSSLTTAQSKYLTYAITYNNGTTYTSSNTSISGVTLAKTTGTASVKVRVEYVQPTDSSQLPATDQSLTLTASLTYQQVQ